MNIYAWRKRLIEFSRFIGAGAASFILILIFVTLLPRLGLNATVAYGVALAIALLFNFLSNRFFVFGAVDGNLRQQAGAYLVVAFAFRGSEWLAFSILVSLTQQQPAMVAFIVQGASTCVKYLVYKRQVFRTR